MSKTRKKFLKKNRFQERHVTQAPDVLVFIFIMTIYKSSACDMRVVKTTRIWVYAFSK